MHSVIKQRMSIMKKAVQMHGEEGYGKVVEAYDAMWERITCGENSAPNSITYVGELVDQFVSDCLKLTSDDQRTQAKDLYSAFRLWCEHTGIESIPSQRKFGTEMILRFERVKRGTLWYVGVTIQDQEQVA